MGQRGGYNGVYRFPHHLLGFTVRVSCRFSGRARVRVTLGFRWVPVISTRLRRVFDAAFCQMTFDLLTIYC